MLNVKEIALKVADSLRNKVDGISHMQSNQGLVRFSEALIAEIAKQNEPMAYIIDGGKFNGRLLHIYEFKLNTNPELERWKVSAKPLYTIPPTAEQIANETAEAIAKFVALQRNDIPATGIEFAEVIRSGAWKEFKK